MACFTLKSMGEEHLVYVDDKDFSRVDNCARTNAGSGGNDYSRPLCVWRILWKGGKIEAVVANVPISFRKTRQVKLHDFIMGDVSKCKAIRHRDGNPLNNYRENLALYQAYKVENIKIVKRKTKSSEICQRCKNEDICQKVVIGKRSKKYEI